ncbi:MAG: hypothetical protein KAI83_20275 [Thiomargarita sp.]|nr:hypothetical protein [Thiomargarita sp.]
MKIQSWPLLFLFLISSSLAETVTPTTISAPSLQQSDYSIFNQALSIVYEQSQTIIGKQKLLGLNIQSSNLSVDVKLAAGYSEKQTQEFAPGFDQRGVITATYPLLGGVTQTDKDKATALTAYYESQDNLKKSFLANMRELRILKQKMDSQIRIHRLRVDLLKRAQKNNNDAIKAGRAQDSVDIVPFVDASLTAEANSDLSIIELKARLEEYSRGYGGERWIELQGLIINYVKAMGSKSL